jgi:hypothetical protein
MPRSLAAQLIFDGQAVEAMTPDVSPFTGTAERVERYGPGE